MSELLSSSKTPWFHRHVALPTLVVVMAVAALSGVGIDRWWVTRALAAGQMPLGQGRVLGMEQLPSQVMDSQDVDFRQFWDTWKILKEKYYQQPLKDKDLFYGALAGLAQSTGDPYTTYFDPKSAQDFQSSLEGKFEGIGAEVGLKDDQLQIVAPLPDTPAERAGLLAGDLILKIDGQETSGMGVEKAVTLIRGKKGTKVVLSIYRPAEKKAQPREVTLLRDEIHVKSVTLKMMPGKIGYITVAHFNDDTEDGFKQAVSDVMRQDPKGIVIDLRNDPGGYLETALNMTSEWVGDQIVVKERRQGKIVEELHGSSDQRLKGVKTVVLVNQGSASASEILAGALQDYGVATLVGTKTFGKGSVQDYQNFKDGSGIKITIAEWLTPKERTINKTGLNPDVVVERTPEDYEAKRDPQLDRAIAILDGSATTTAKQAATTSSRP